VASPVVAGCVALLASTVPAERRWELLNPGSMKQALIEGADRLPGLNQYEQGNGRVNLAATQRLLANYTPRASLVPARLDFTECPYAWPYCKQGAYAFGLPLVFNATVLNGMGVTGRFSGAPSFKPANEAGRLLGVSFTWSDMLWPWSGFLGLAVEVCARSLWCGRLARGQAARPSSPASTAASSPRRPAAAS
jgi:membrane-bound transcription factor site-1 protease